MDPIIILEKVNVLYSTFLGYFLTITGIIAILYSLLPFILNSIQARSFEKERKRLDEEIKKDIDKLRGELNDELKNTLEVEKKKVLEELNISVAKTQASVMFNQGIRLYTDHSYHLSTISFLDALTFALQGKDERNAKTCLRWLINETLPQLFMDSFIDEDLEIKLNISLEELRKVNQNGRYTDEIKIVQLQIKEARMKQVVTIQPS
jgi:hypothetical protein